MFYFFVAFVVLMLGFAIGGWVIFGAQIDDYSTIGDALIANSNILLMGNVDWDSMRQVSPTLALLYCWSFIAMLMLVMLNILLAILIDSYENCKEQLISDAAPHEMPAKHLMVYPAYQIVIFHRHLYCLVCGGHARGTLAYCEERVKQQALGSSGSSGSKPVTEFQLRTWHLPAAVAAEVMAGALEYSRLKGDIEGSSFKRQRATFLRDG